MRSEVPYVTIAFPVIAFGLAVYGTFQLLPAPRNTVLLHYCLYIITSHTLHTKLASNTTP